MAFVNQQRLKHQSTSPDLTARAGRAAVPTPPRRIGRYNKRLQRPIATVHELLLILGGGQRLDILSLLARGSLNVGQIAKQTFLDINVVSRELAMLEQRGMVEWRRDGNFRIYRLTRNVRAYLHNGSIQIATQIPAGDWVLVHVNLGASSESDSSPLPNGFINPEPLRAPRAGHANQD